MKFITVVEALVIIHWRLRPRQRKVVCAMCKGNTLSGWHSSAFRQASFPLHFAGAIHHDGSRDHAWGDKLCADLVRETCRR